MRTVPPQLTRPLLDKQLDRLRYWASAARYPALRGEAFRLGPGAHLEIAREAQITAAGFLARGDLTLIVHGRLSIGANVFLNRGVYISAMQSVTIGSFTGLGPRVTVVDAAHVSEPLSDFETRYRAFDAEPIVIGDRVRIGTGSVVLPGVTIGDDAVIGAGSIVSRDVPPGTVAVGAPAQVRRTLRP